MTEVEPELRVYIEESLQRLYIIVIADLSVRSDVKLPLDCEISLQSSLCYEGRWKGKCLSTVVV